MKKTLFVTISLVVLMLGLIPLTGATCGSQLSESDIATIRGLGTRLDVHDQDISTLQTKTANLTADTLEKLVALDTDTLEWLAALDTDVLETLMNLDLAAFETWKANVDTGLGDLESRVEALEAGGGGGSPPVPPTGQVTVAISTQTPMTQILSTPTPSPKVFFVTIANATAAPQYVTFGIILTVCSPTVSANVTMTTLSLSGTVYGSASYPFGAFPAPSAATAQQILFTFPATAPKVLVMAGQTVTLFIALDLRTDPYAYWQGSVTGVVISSS